MTGEEERFELQLIREYIPSSFNWLDIKIRKRQIEIKGEENAELTSVFPYEAMVYSGSITVIESLEY